MRFIIHRGTREIGGNCIQLESRGKSIFLDFGMPLTLPETGEYSSREILKKDWKELVEHKYLPNVKELYTQECENILGILISHAHQDHYGFLNYITKNIPCYSGKKAQILMQVTAKFTPMHLENIEWSFFEDRVSFTLGPFKVTPYLVDHSAFDAYAFLIEADGRKLFYSGDLRAHGRKHWAFPRLMQDLPKDIDVMMIETTMLGRDDWNQVLEEDLEGQMVDVMKLTAGMVLFQASAQNIDRIVTAYRAALQSGRTLIMDGYTACVYKALGVDSLPHYSWDRVKIYFNKSYIIKSIRGDEACELLFPFKDNRITGEEIGLCPEKYVLMFRESMIDDFAWKSGISSDTLGKSSYLYSMWKGYWDRMDRMKDFITNNGVRGPFYIHGSGHAYVADLHKLISAVRPSVVVPIHGFNTYDFESDSCEVKLMKDYIWMEI